MCVCNLKFLLAWCVVLFVFVLYVLQEFCVFVHAYNLLVCVRVCVCLCVCVGVVCFFVLCGVCVCG